MVVTALDWTGSATAIHLKIHKGLEWARATAQATKHHLLMLTAEAVRHQH